MQLCKSQLATLRQLLPPLLTLSSTWALNSIKKRKLKKRQRSRHGGLIIAALLS